MSVRGFAAIVLAVVILSSGVTVEADTIYVPGDYPTIAEAIATAYSGDRIIAESGAFNYEPTIDWLGKAIRLESQNYLTQPDSGVYRLAAGGILASATGQSMQLYGMLRSPLGGSGDVECGSFHSTWTGAVVVQAQSQLNISANSIDLESNVSVEQGGTLSLASGQYNIDSTGLVSLATDARLNVLGWLDLDCLVGESGSSINVCGELRVDESMIMSDCSVTTGDSLSVGSYASAALYDCDLTIGGDELNNEGRLQIWNGLILAEGISNYDSMDLLNTTMSADNLFNINYGEMYGSGMWTTDLTNAGDLRITDDVTIIGDVVNNGVITIYNGNLTILGVLNNENGTIVGSVRGEDKRGYDPRLIRVGGALRLGAEAQLHLPTADWQFRVDADCDIAIRDNLAFDLSRATLTLGTLAGANVEYEVMSRDIGPSATGLERAYPGHFPIGTLHVAGAMVNLVDVRDNDLQGNDCGEAVYVDTLQIDAGAILNNDGYRIYYNTLINNGFVSNAVNLVEIGSGIPGDLDGDGDVDLTDLADLLGSYGLCQGDAFYNPAADFDVSGCVDISDLAVLLGNYGG